MRKVLNLVVHCTATAQSATIAAIQKHWKTKLGWKSPGYHIIIPPNGSIVRLAEDDAICNGVAGHNSTSLHVSYIGGVDANGKALDNRTAEQSVAIVEVLRAWRKKYPKAKIKGHRDFSPDKDGDGVVEAEEWMKMCPSFDAVKEYRGI